MTQLCNVLFAEIYLLLLGIGIHLHAEHFPSFATHHGTDCTADGGGKLHFGILLVDKQGIPGLDMITFLHKDFRSDSLEIIRNQRILSL